METQNSQKKSSYDELDDRFFRRHMAILGALQKENAPAIKTIPVKNPS